MAFLIGGANSAADTGYDIDNSLRFNDDDSPELNMQLDTPTSDKIYTFSLWAKRGNLGLNSTLIGHYSGSGDSLLGVIQFTSAGKLRVSAYDDEYDASPTNFLTTRVFRDPSAWYHIVIAVDTTDGTEANRFKIYVNGVQESVFDTEAYPTLNKVMVWNKDDMYAYYGIYKYAGGVEHDGYISELHFIDGTQLAASAFGEFDEDSGIWKPKDAKDDLTYGNNGHYLEFKETGTNQDSSGIGADTSGNDNHFAVTNLAATDQCVDTPTNNWATFNPLEPDVASGETLTPLVYSEGNLKVVGQTSGTGYSFAISTIAVSSGKWYYEFYRPDTDSGTVICGCQNPGLYDSSGLHSLTNSNGGGVGIRGSNGTLYNDGSESSPANGTEYKDAGDILSVKLNMDDNEISFSTNGAAYTSGISLSSYVLSSGFVSPGANIGDDEELIVNFGNPVWVLSSGNADANGYGNFEYAVPSGYYALCTKNLAEYG